MAEPTGKLLIVDDDPHIRRLLQLYCRGTGLEVHEAATGEEAESLIDQNRYAVVLLDLILPYYGGFRICQKLKRVPRQSQPFVIMMTGDDSQETRASAAECGADHFLPKPFSAVEVRDLVTSVVGRKSVV
jgi:DNA-binding response OmpR family regulator